MVDMRRDELEGELNIQRSSIDKRKWATTAKPLISTHGHCRMSTNMDTSYAQGIVSSRDSNQAFKCQECSTFIVREYALGKLTLH